MRVLVVPRQREGQRPRPREGFRVLDPRLVVDPVGRRSREALDDLQRRALRDPFHPARRRAGRNPVPVAEVGGLDHQRVAFPAAARVALQQAHRRRQRRTAIQRDDPRVVDHLGVNHDVAGRLDDLVGVVVAGRDDPPRHAARDAPVPHAHELGMVGAALQRLVSPGLGFGADRDPAIRGIDHERGLPGGQDGRARVEPELVVAADVAPGDGLLPRG